MKEDTFSFGSLFRCHSGDSSARCFAFSPCKIIYGEIDRLLIQNEHTIKHHRPNIQCARSFDMNEIAPQHQVYLWSCVRAMIGVRKMPNRTVKITTNRSCFFSLQRTKKQHQTNKEWLTENVDGMHRVKYRWSCALMLLWSNAVLLVLKH